VYIADNAVMLMLWYHHFTFAKNKEQEAG